MPESAALKIWLPSERETIKFGEILAKSIDSLELITLRGDLGAGKTTLVRALLRGLGFLGKVKSPTYTLIESYEVGSKPVHHFDLYRIADPDELEFLGFAEYFDKTALLLVEWPEMGQGVLPTADLELQLTYSEKGRMLELTGFSTVGEQTVTNIQSTLDLNKSRGSSKVYHLSADTKS